MILCDAGPLFVLVDKKQPKHFSVRKAIEKLNSPLVTTWPCFAEAMYLSYRKGGWFMQNQLGKLLFNEQLIFYEIQPRDYIALRASQKSKVKSQK